MIKKNIDKENNDKKNNDKKNDKKIMIKNRKNLENDDNN